MRDAFTSLYAGGILVLAGVTHQQGGLHWDVVSD
jgi:hypothetical protein